MASNGVLVVRLSVAFRMLALLLLAASVVLMATNNFKLSDGSKTSFMDVIAYRYVTATSAVALLYTVVQVPFGLYHAFTEKRFIRNNCLPEFDFYGDKVVSLLLATGVGAGFAVTFEFKRHLNDMIVILELLSGQNLNELESKNQKFLDRAIMATGLLFLGFICMATLSILSSLSRSSPKSTSKGFFG